jgi:hypothetical protein
MDSPEVSSPNAWVRFFARLPEGRLTEMANALIPGSPEESNPTDRLFKRPEGSRRMKSTEAREIDNAIATQIMDYGEPVEVWLEGCDPTLPWARLTVYRDYPGPKDNNLFGNYVRVGGPAGKRLSKPYWVAPSYSTDIAAAWPLVERFRLTVGHVLDDPGNNLWAAWRGSGVDRCVGHGQSAPEAICRAALASISNPKEGTP